MTINEMHILFRNVGQQMGMQQIRGILPQSIDNFLNIAIAEKCRSILIGNTSTPQQDILTQRNNYISAVNSLRTLYRSKVFVIDNTESVEEPPYQITVVSGGTIPQEELFELIAFRCKVDNKIRDCRIIEADRIGSVINDYCNKPSDEYPAITLISRVTNSNNIIIVGNIYLDNYSKLTELQCDYIKNPVKVSLENSVNCDLPDYLHNEIVQIAVDKYFTSVGSTTHNVKQ